MILMIFSLESDIFGVERHVPHISDIESVYLVNWKLSHREQVELSNSALGELLVKDTEFIYKTIAMHQTIVSNREALRQAHSEGRRRGRSASYFSILYKLNDGSVIVRRYYLPEWFRAKHNIDNLLFRSQLSMSLFQNHQHLIHGVRVLSDLEPTLNLIINRQNHVLEFVNSLKNDDFSLGHTRTAHWSNRVEILIDSPLRSVIAFGINDCSSIREWLAERGY